MKVKNMDMRQINKEMGEFDFEDSKRAGKNRKELLKKVKG